MHFPPSFSLFFPLKIKHRKPCSAWLTGRQGVGTLQVPGNGRWGARRPLSGSPSIASNEQRCSCGSWWRRRCAGRLREKIASPRGLTLLDGPEPSGDDALARSLKQTRGRIQRGRRKKRSRRSGCFFVVVFWVFFFQQKLQASTKPSASASH